MAGAWRESLEALAGGRVQDLQPFQVNVCLLLAMGLTQLLDVATVGIAEAIQVVRLPLMCESCASSTRTAAS